MIERISKLFAKCCVEVAQWLYYKDRLLFLANALYRYGSWIYLRYSKPTVTLHVTDEWMYDWQFHYNVYTKTWRAFHREDANAYWSGGATVHPMYEANCTMSLLRKLEEDHAH